MTAAPAIRADVERPADVVAAARLAVRDLLLQSPGYAEADPELRRELAAKMVNVALLGADLAAEELGLSQRPQRARRPLATAQAAPPAKEDFRAVKSAAGTVAALRKAIDFPAYVTSLINGVFQAICTSNLQQITAIAEMLDNVSASADDFTMQNVDDGAVLAWATGKFPFLARDGSSLTVKDGVDLTEMRSTLKNGLGATDEQVDSIDAGDLDGTFMPLARAKMGKDRQQILGTLIQMGLQRIVVDEGRLHASMDMRVDAKSIDDAQHAGQTADSVAAAASASAAYGPFSASASFSVSHSSVQSDAELSKDEIAVRAGLRSSVDLAFRTEQVPLDKMANEKARVKLNSVARVPEDVSSGGSLLGDEKIPGVGSTGADKKAEDDRKAMESKAEEGRKAAEKKAAEEKKAEEAKKAAEEKKAADKKAADEKKAAEAKKAADKGAAGTKTADAKVPDAKPPDAKTAPAGENKGATP